MRRPFLRLTAFLIFMGASSAHADPLITQFIDDEIDARIRKERALSAGRADDATLVRRIYIDLLGRCPSVKEASDFRDDVAADKVHRLIERLRQYPESAANWRRVMASWLQVGSQQFRDDEFMEYFGRAAATNLGWDWIARDLLNPKDGIPRQKGASGYLAHFLKSDDDKAGRQAATLAVASAFFGVQLQCARCHDHPSVPEWTKAHFDGLFAFFEATSSVRGKEVTRLREGPRANRAQLMFLDGKKFTPSSEPRAVLAEYATSPDAVHFKRAIVNRVWKQLLGRGLVEPVDLICSDNPASHPKLFEKLADDFAANGFNLDRLISSIMHTEAYLRSARWTGPADKRPAESLFAVALVRPLSGPQMAWSIASATGYAQAFSVAPLIERPDLPRGKGLTLLARYKWESSEEFNKLTDVFRESASAATASHAIYLSFDPFMKKVLEPASNFLVGQLLDEKDNEAVVTHAYQAILNRAPTAEEVAIVKKHLKASKTKTAGCQDLAWALLASAEFRFNH